jgi:aminoimidazole riboside kinase
MMHRPAVVLGDANIDLVIRLPDRAADNLDMSQSVPQVCGGGSAANVAVALARLGVPVAFIGCIGDDGYGRWVRQDLAREGVDGEGLCYARDAFTAMVMAIVEPGGERLLVVWPPEGGAHTRLCVEDIDPSRIANAAWLHTTGICLRASPVREAVLHAMRRARAASVPVSLDLNLRAELWGMSSEFRACLQSAMELADVVLGNADEEIVPLAGGASVEDSAQLLSGGQRIVVARQGADGALAATPEGIVRVAAFATRIVDTVGAGDAFDGGFIAARVAGYDVRHALRWGNAAAALKIRRPGARGLPTHNELEEVLR